MPVLLTQKISLEGEVVFLYHVSVILCPRQTMHGIIYSQTMDSTGEYIREGERQ